ncbi:MAG: serine hydrolase [Streptosporangiales bacterium]|nr:serine hydrolase [Streptosporangiales bacterium]
MAAGNGAWPVRGSGFTGGPPSSGAFGDGAMMRLDALTGGVGLSRRALIGGLLAAGLALAVAVVLAPRAPRLGPQTTGDPGLASAVRAVAGERGHQGLSVALVEGDRVRTAGLGDSGDAGRPAVDATTGFEIGSIGKALTGMLLADLAADGAVPLDAPLREVLPGVRFADPETGSITVRELASHRSGLPRLPLNAGTLGRMTMHFAAGHNPYEGIGPADVVAAAAGASPDGRGEFGYSNLGMAVAGEVAARRAGTSYPELLRERILAPLGMDRTVVLAPRQPAPFPHAVGQKSGGQYAEMWRGAGYAPAGVGMWSTSADLARFAGAMLDGTAPGAAAAQPRFDVEENERIGLGWFTTKRGDREITWHNGGTGGFRSFIGLDRAADRAVVVLGNTDRDVDDIGLRLLDVDPKHGFDWRGSLILGLTFFFPLSAGFGVLGVVRRRDSDPRRQADRLTLVASVVSGAAVLLIAWRIGLWHQVPAAVWVAGVVTTAGGAWLGALRWRRLPTARGPRRWQNWVGAIFSVAFSGAVLALASGLV